MCERLICGFYVCFVGVRFFGIRVPSLGSYLCFAAGYTAAFPRNLSDSPNLGMAVKLLPDLFAPPPHSVFAPVASLAFAETETARGIPGWE